MQNLVDLHAHILPGLDDGPEDLSESLVMLEVLQEIGFSHVFATPHHRLNSWTGIEPDTVEKDVRVLRIVARREGLKIVIHPGMEFDLDDTLDHGSLTPPGGAGHLLVDIGFWGVPPNLSEILGRVMSSGTRVLLVHPERNPKLCRKKRELARLIASGVKLLGNIGSFSGMYGNRARRDARNLLKAGLYWAMASDMHSGDQSDWIREGVEELLGLAGNGAFHEMMSDRPMQMVKAMGSEY